MNKPLFKPGDHVVFTDPPKMRDYTYSMSFIENNPTNGQVVVVKKISKSSRIISSNENYYFCDCFKLDETQLFHEQLELLVNNSE